jgi:hypothetical protein
MTFDDEPDRPGHQHYPGGLHGPSGDDAHQMHQPLEASREAHATEEQLAVSATVQHEPEQLPPPTRRFTSRFDSGSNPFGAPA